MVARGTEAGSGGRPIDPATRCVHCGEVTGLYEPMIIVVDRWARETSRLVEPDLFGEEGQRYHRACYTERYPDSPPAPRHNRRE